jgi:STE24 endopeptidase
VRELKYFGVTLALALTLIFSCFSAKSQDQPPPELPPHRAPTIHVEAADLPALDTTPKFDPEKAVAGYLARVGGAARARSDAYFENGYWLQLLDLLYALAIAGVLLGFGISTRMRDWAQDRTHSRNGQVLLYAIGYTIITAVMALPLSVYEGFFREHAYGLSNQSFADWLGDWSISFALTLVASVILLPALYAAIRAARLTWWVWGSGIAIAFIIFQMVITPIFIAPLFNHYSPLQEGALKRQILSLARANQIPATDIYVVDASRQSNRISANVSGFLGTTRISLNDNLLKQASPDEVLAVLGHEMGHYVMGHATRGVLLTGLVITIGFGFVAWAFRLTTDLFGGTWHVRRPEDVAGLPILVALASIFLFVMTPVTNTITRTAENQADIFGLDAVRKPDAFASVIVKLSSYRKLDPGKWEEMIFYDHPSGRTRIETAMRWKKEHIADQDIRETTSPQ